MGTQQIILIVLGVIIVGVAVVVGINIFGTNADNASKDAITQDCLRLAAAAQSYYRKPALLGGGGNSFVGVTLPMLGMSANGKRINPLNNNSTEGENINATYAIIPIGPDMIQITGRPSTIDAVVAVNVHPGTIDVPHYEGW